MHSYRLSATEKSSAIRFIRNVRHFFIRYPRDLNAHNNFVNKIMIVSDKIQIVHMNALPLNFFFIFFMFSLVYYNL